MFSDLYIPGIKPDRSLPGDRYLSASPVVKPLRIMGELPIRSRATFFAGENGVVKSTLIVAVAVAIRFNPEGGTINLNISTGLPTRSCTDTSPSARA